MACKRKQYLRSPRARPIKSVELILETKTSISSASRVCVYALLYACMCVVVAPLVIDHCPLHGWSPLFFVCMCSFSLSVSFVYSISDLPRVYIVITFWWFSWKDMSVWFFDNFPIIFKRIRAAVSRYWKFLFIDIRFVGYTLDYFEISWITGYFKSFKSLVLILSYDWNDFFFMYAFFFNWTEYYMISLNWCDQSIIIFWCTLIDCTYSYLIFEHIFKPIVIRSELKLYCYKL